MLIAILGLILLCLHRRKEAKKAGVHEAPSAPPTELAVNPYHPHEMSTTTASKYVSAHEPPGLNELPAYSGLGQTQPGHAGYDQTPSNNSNLSQGHGYTASHSAGSHGLPQDTGYHQPHHSPLRSPNTAELYFPSDHATHDTQQGSQRSYPTPTSPYGRDTHQGHSAVPSNMSPPAQFYAHEVSPDASTPRGGSGHGASDRRYGNHL